MQPVADHVETKTSTNSDHRTGNDLKAETEWEALGRRGSFSSREERTRPRLKARQILILLSVVSHNPAKPKTTAGKSSNNGTTLVNPVSCFPEWIDCAPLRLHCCCDPDGGWTQENPQPLSVQKDGQSFPFQKVGQHRRTKDLHSINRPATTAKVCCKNYKWLPVI